MMVPDGRAALLQRLDVKTLLLFRALQIGDMLCAVPALRAFRAALPETRIVLIGLPWAAQFASRFSAYVDAFLPFPGHPGLPEQPVHASGLAGLIAQVRALHAQLGIQLHGSGRISNDVLRRFGAQTVAGFTESPNGLDRACWLRYPEHQPEPLRLLALASHLGAPARGCDLEFPLTASDEDGLRQSGVAGALFCNSKQRDYICLHPGARSRDKCWPVQHFAAVGDALARHYGLPIVLTGSAAEHELTTRVADAMHSPAINAAGPVALGAMAALIKMARLLICNDTGVSHIAAGLRVPSVVIFSTSDPTRWAPLDHGLHRIVIDPHGTRFDAVMQQAHTLLRSLQEGERH